MVPDWHGQAEQRLEKTVERRRLAEIGAANHMGDALVGVVDNDREMIRDANVAPCEDDVARRGEKRRAVDGVDARIERPRLGQGEWTGGGEGAGEIEADRVARTGLGHRAPAAGAGIDRRPRSALLRRGEGGANLGPGASAGVGEPDRRQPVECGGVAAQMLGLAQHRLGPAEAEPGKILEDRRLVLRAGAAAVDVLDAKKEIAGLDDRQIPGGQGGEGMPEMQAPCWRGCEARAQGVPPRQSPPRRIRRSSPVW